MIKVLSRRPLVLFKRGPRNNSSNKNKFSNVSLIVNIYHIALMVKEMKMNTKEEKTMIEVLPKDCIANILSHTTPIDSCRLSLISKDFCSASKSDIVWNKFLPSDLVSIISDSQSASSLFDTSLSKKSLYLILSDHPIIIDSGKKVSYQNYSYFIIYN
jgi:hypothetical protein